jgi:threonylcarbamoyladenosine tRNA methylthiotransferase MtaB
MKVYLDTIGCRLNQSEIESMARQFRAAGHEIVAAAGSADMAVVNTCAVTAAAASDSRATIRRIARAGAGKIVASGCWATLQPESAAGLPKVWRVVTNDDKDRLVSEALNLPSQIFDLEPMAREPLPGLRRRTRALIKVQDGCNNHCTFCITTLARGKARSRAAEDVISDVQSALDGGAQEIVLTGVHLGSWGQELGLHLKFLVQTILRETRVRRLRLSSLEPWDLDAGFFSLWEEPRLCRHLHLPLQSGCAATLKRMARKTTPNSFRQLLAAARQVMPEAAITTDMIAGFPGETQAEFEESLDFVREMNFAGGHAFSYSARPGTAAERLEGQLPPHVRQERSAEFRGLFDAQAKAYREKFIGQFTSVLWESTTQIEGGGWRLEGLTGNYLRVAAMAPTARWNEIEAVDLTEAGMDGLVGVIRKSG